MYNSEIISFLYSKFILLFIDIAKWHIADDTM